jgi:hypothetical protein
MFVKVFAPDGRKEVLIDPAHIWKIEVEYFVPNQNAKGEWVWKENQYFKCSLDEGHNNPEAVRRYTFFVAGEAIPLVSSPDDPIHSVLERLYKGCAP